MNSCKYLIIYFVDIVTQEDIQQLLNRYARYDESSRGTVGLDVNTVLRMPELSENPLIPSILRLFVDKQTKRLHPEHFINFCAALGSHMSIENKKRGD